MVTPIGNLGTVGTWHVQNVIYPYLGKKTPCRGGNFFYVLDHYRIPRHLQVRVRLRLGGAVPASQGPDRRLRRLHRRLLRRQPRPKGKGTRVGLWRLRPTTGIESILFEMCQQRYSQFRIISLRKNFGMMF